MSNTKKLKTGLRLLPEDQRDYRLGSIISIKDFPILSDLPDEFSLEPIDLKDQIDDFCSGNTTALLIGTNEGMPIDENWMFAVSKVISGDPDSYGQDLRVAFKVGVEYGALPKTNSPFTSDKGSKFLRRIENWPEGIDFYASPQKQKTFWKVTGPYDDFDNIRATIWYLNKLGQKQGVGIGLIWGYPASEYILSEIKKGDGHALSVIGWKKPLNETYLLLQNSWGKSAGKDGKHLISREVINHFAEQFGAFVYIDLPREKAEHYLEHNIKISDNWLIQFFKVIWNFLRPNRTFGAERSSEWGKTRKIYLQNNSKCEVCGKKEGLLNRLNVHHIMPFHLDPKLELDPNNLITLCRNHHFDWGHFLSWKSFNKEVRLDVKRIHNRP